MHPTSLPVPHSESAFLGVERSCTGRRWLARDYDERTALALAQRHNLPDIIAKSLSARGIALDDAPAFLDPKLRDLLPDPGCFKDMEKAAARFVEAVTRGESIAVFGDYDVDGATSSALLLRFGRALGVDIKLYVPDRMREGYGPNANALRQLAGEGVKLVICVDCGTTAHEPLAAARDAGLEVIILDHHASEPDLPPAVAVVNPNRIDQDGEYGYLAAVGVTYLFVIAANRALRVAGFYTNASKNFAAKDGVRAPSPPVFGGRGEAINSQQTKKDGRGEVGGAKTESISTHLTPTQFGNAGISRFPSPPEDGRRGGDDHSSLRPDYILEPDLLQWLDLVALGTVCDVVKLTGLNRALVAQGLKIMAQRRNAGIAALAQVAGARVMDAYAAGFLLGPRVNAGGRVGEAALGAKLLSTDDADVAASLAQHLHGLNNERREIEAQVLREAEALTMTENLPLAFVASENWHPGVIGIVASRLKDKFRHPALVIALDGEIGKGSGRSIGAIDLGAHVIAARQAGLLINGGGHKMAAGLTVARDKIDALRDFLVTRIGKQMEAEPLVPTLVVDGLVAGQALTPEFVRQLAVMSPFGTGNSEPRYALADCAIVRADIVGEKHVSVIFMQGGVRLRGIAFRAMESELGQALLTTKRLHLAGHLRIDEWQGVERVQMHIGDAAVIG